VRPAPASAATESDPVGLTTVTVRLAARPPFDGAGLVRYVADHAVTGVEDVDGDGTVRRWISLPHGPALVRLRLDDERPGVICTASVTAISDLAPLVARVRRWFDLDADAAAIDEALGADALLGPLVAARPGIRIPGAVDAAETLLRTIVGQQISLPSARTVLGRLAADLDEVVDIAPVAGLRTFPTAERLAVHGAQVLRGPAARIRTILGVAEALASGDLSIDVGMPAAELHARLMAMPGIGPWTAGYVTMRVLGAPDILLIDDLVLLRALRAAGAAETSRQARMLGEGWAPWRSYATLHLWRSAPPAMRRTREDGAPADRRARDEP
jgi:AraC family transcriptional regulator, regulatory protein of adaptative response / DNA-3-methyladenine glycosylase II